MTPDEHTNQEFWLDVGDGHKIYVQDWGKADAKIPILFLHGGPGAGCNDGHKKVFDPSIHRVIFFDQRGSGKSLPFGSIHENTTDKLMADIDKLRKHLNLDEVYVYGRSWGSTMALLYAIHFPETIRALFIGGVYLASSEENAQETETGKKFFPELWQDFLKATPKAAQDDPVKYHQEQILNGSDEAAKKSAYEYSKLTAGSMRLDDRQRTIDYETFDWLDFKIGAHYSLHRHFLENDYILKHAAQIKVPVYIVQGRYDINCLPRVAYELHQKLPGSHLFWAIGGHSGSDRAIYDITKTLLATRATS